jgi:UDP-2-acetamido-3-amino-2,3-dideoxy-glucuronate N-acetyltransferase
MSEAPFIHSHALVEPGVQIGSRTRVWAFVHILPGARIGADCNICDHVFIENDVVIGDRVTVKCGIYIWNGVSIGDDVFLGPNVVFTNDLFPRSKRHITPVPTSVQQFASIGANATVLPGVTIGYAAMIGSGTVVTRDVPPFALIVGNPGRQVGWVCLCGQRIEELHQQIVPCSCGRLFDQASHTVLPSQESYEHFRL